MGYSARVITVSDRCFRGERADKSGPAVVEMLAAAHYKVDKLVLVPDEIAQIEQALREAAQDDVALCVTTGGTGFAPRDVTPEATVAVCEKLVPGIPEAMRARSMALTPRAMLSRAQAGILSRTLIVNLPGSPSGAEENLEAVICALDHGLEMLRGEGSADCAAKQ